MCCTAIPHISVLRSHSHHTHARTPAGDSMSRHGHHSDSRFAIKLNHYHILLSLIFHIMIIMVIMISNLCMSSFILKLKGSLRLRSILCLPTFLVIIGQGIFGTAPWFAFSYLTMWLELNCFENSEAASIYAFFNLGTAISSHSNLERLWKVRLSLSKISLKVILKGSLKVSLHLILHKIRADIDALRSAGRALAGLHLPTLSRSWSASHLPDVRLHLHPTLCLNPLWLRHWKLRGPGHIGHLLSGFHCHRHTHWVEHGDEQ